MTAILTHTMHGVPAAGYSHPQDAGAGTKPAPYSGVEYIGTVRCGHEGGGVCTAPRAKKTEFCIGHLRSQQKRDAEEAATVAARGDG